MTLRTIIVPTAPGASLDDLAWSEAKVAADTLVYAVDLGAWLQDAQQKLLGAVVGGTADLILGEPAFLSTGGQATGVLIEIGGGAPGATSAVQVVLSLSQGCQLTLRIALLIVPADLTTYQPSPVPQTAALHVLGLF